MFHIKCNHPVIIKIPGISFVIQETSVDNRRSKLTGASYSLYREDSFSPETPIALNPYCPSCKTFVPLEEIAEFCGHCGEASLIKEIMYSKEVGGRYCEKCVKKILSREGKNTYHFLLLSALFEKGISLS